MVNTMDGGDHAKSNGPVKMLKRIIGFLGLFGSAAARLWLGKGWWR